MVHAGPGDSTRLRVVAVEDDRLAREWLASKLSAAGLDVTGCDPTVADPLTTIFAIRPDVVLLDWRLSTAQSGLQLCRQLRQSDPGRDLPIVFFTALDDPRDREAARRAGADGFCVKGTDPDQLAAHIRHAVSLRHRAVTLHPDPR